MKKIKLIKEGNVTLPKDPKTLTVIEFYFIAEYFNKASKVILKLK